MKCAFYRCPHRARKYLLNKVHDLAKLIREGASVNDSRAHPYCEEHWEAVKRRYWR